MEHKHGKNLLVIILMSFLHQLDYISADLDNVDTLRHLPNYLHDNTYFLSVPPERYANAIINLKEAG